MIDQLPAIVVLAAFAGAVFYAAATDLTSYTIPNRASLAVLGAFALYAPVSGLPLETLAWHLAAFAAVLTGAFVLFALGWIGGGDAKLAAAIALWIGWPLLPAYLFQTAMFGAGLTLALVLMRRFPLPIALARVGWVSRLHDPRAGVPYGVALACSAFAALPALPVWRLAFPA